MALDPYAPCPCGSGKRFKWCCQPIHVQIDKALQMDADGQHDAALKLMDEVVAEHSANPEAWGRKAQLLYANGRVEDAESALQKAFEINPNYPFGHLLRASFRFHEGELPGALILFRRAAELYDPEAKDVLGDVYSRITDLELKLNRPVAARAALAIAVHLLPHEEELRKGFEALFGDKAPLPLSARRDYKFMSPAADAPANRRAAWDQALAGAASGKLTDAARAFYHLTQDDGSDKAAWFNLGLARAWLGDNRGALEALERYVNLETDDAAAAQSWALSEVLRCGYGVDDDTDYHEESIFFQLRDMQQLLPVLQEWEQSRKLIAAQILEAEQALTGLLLDTATGLTVAGVASHSGKIGAYLILVGDLLRLRSPRKEALERVSEELKQRTALGLQELRRVRGPLMVFGDTLAEAVTFPVGVSDQAEAQRIVRENAQNYFEDRWIHQPLRSLGGATPVDATEGTLRKKVRGVVQFLEECAVGGVVQGYDFNRLRRKLGLAETPTAASATTAVAAPPPASVDIASMGASDLAGLQPDALAPAQLEQAYQTAVKLAAHDLAALFARAAVARPPQPGNTDRFAFWSFLTQQALAEGKTDDALNYVNEGEKDDCEHNEGRRRNDFEWRRGQVHVKRGEADQAKDVFDRLIERAPGELRYRGAATEGMLSLKQPAQALRFADGGLAKAREQNDRDSEQYFLELAAAARKQGA
jgi:tetratricopeptide (TPR) repeat protein